MKAYQVVENGKPLEEKEIETPVPSGKEILLKTVSCGVCHSDVHIHDGYFDLGGDMKLPMPLAEPLTICLLYTSPSPRDYAASRMPSSA